MPTLSIRVGCATAFQIVPAMETLRDEAERLPKVATIAWGDITMLTLIQRHPSGDKLDLHPLITPDGQPQYTANILLGRPRYMGALLLGLLDQEWFSNDPIMVTVTKVSP